MAQWLGQRAPRTAFPDRIGITMAVVCLGIVFSVPISTRSAGPTDPTPDQEIAVLIQQLGDRSFAVRASASRGLCKLGPLARPALEEAARSDDYEVAFRAKALLGVFDQLIFAGCEIEIALSKTRIAWDEAIDLTLIVRNPSAYPATLPFAAPSSQERQPSSSEAQQVAGLLDLADFLEVTAPTGSPVAFHVDALGVDPAIEAVVRDRVENGPTTRLQPGQSVHYRASNINRGWARYPMIRKGAYRITVAYKPEWDDAEFTRAGVGSLRSNTVEVAVTRGAPAGVVGASASPQLVLTQEQSSIAARMQNRQDVPIWLNTNFGFGSPPSASFRWLVYADSGWRDCLLKSAGAPAGVFSVEKLVELAPGEVLELDSAELAVLREAAGLTEGEPLYVRASYSNLCDRAWQGRQKTLPEALESPLPARLLFTTLTAEPLRID